MSKVRLVSVLIATGLMSSAASPTPTEGRVPFSTESENLDAIFCEMSVCMQATNWICAGSSEPDPEDVMWHYCNAHQGSGPFDDWTCELPE